ncbi:hypothetical protein [Marinicellulosiphila megalodicopiae]|uniref:hypothetical protein n=1 Tax=Marinicellulosiphila megalodicopiae TaxID=2724896 RepID=UPI003BB00AD6
MYKLTSIKQTEQPEKPMNLKTIITTATMITTLSTTTMLATADNSSRHYDSHSVTQYTLDKRKNDRYTEQLENKIKRLEELLALADKFIERYILSDERPTRNYNQQNIPRRSSEVTVYSCAMSPDSRQTVILEINTDRKQAKNDLIQECRNSGYRQCAAKQITCESQSVSTSHRNNH